MDDKAFTGKRRSQNWQDDEEVMLIEEVKTRSGALFGLMKGSGAKGKLKVTREREWQLIADSMKFGRKTILVCIKFRIYS